MKGVIHGCQHFRSRTSRWYRWGTPSLTAASCTESNQSAAMEGPSISEAEHEITLHEERPIISKQAVPKERVRLDTDTVTEQRQVSDQLRKEQIDAESVDAGRHSR